MRCISRARSVLEPDIKKRYDCLVNIGIDETCYRKGHNYVTTVVNHDTNSIVWCAPGHSTEVLSKFFEELTDEQRQSIKSVSGDGAKQIDACIEKYIPHAKRCVDAFHVVAWATECLDELRKEAWRDAYSSYKDKAKEKKEQKFTEADDYDFIREKIKERSDETIANIAITLIHQCDVLIRGLIEWKKRDFKEKGGIKEEMYRARKDWQKRNFGNGRDGDNKQGM